MNRLFILMISVMIISCQLANGQKDKLRTDHSDEDFEFSDVYMKTTEYSATELTIYNLNGDVTIKSYNGSKIKVTTKNTIKANSQETIKLAKNEIKLGVENEDDLTLFIEAPYDTRPGKQNEKKMSWENKKYHFEVSYEIALPANTKLNLNTVNGDISVVSVTGDIITANVNGDITLKDVNKVSRATTVNGDVNVNSSESNDVASEYTTVNGDINLSLPEQFAGECLFKSLNGDFYTDFENFEALGDLKTTKENHNGITRYKLDKSQGIRIGNGAGKVKFETLNGDVHLKRS